MSKLGDLKSFQKRLLPHEQLWSIFRIGNTQEIVVHSSFFEYILMVPSFIKQPDFFDVFKRIGTNLSWEYRSDDRDHEISDSRVSSVYRQQIDKSMRSYRYRSIVNDVYIWRDRNYPKCFRVLKELSLKLRISRMKRKRVYTRR